MVHLFGCVVTRGAGKDSVQRTCHLTCPVTVDPDLFDSVRRTLIVCKKLVTFNHLRKMRNLTVVRRRLYINIGKDLHTGGH